MILQKDAVKVKIIAVLTKQRKTPSIYPLKLMSVILLFQNDVSERRSQNVEETLATLKKIFLSFFEKELVRYMVRAFWRAIDPGYWQSHVKH